MNYIKQILYELKNQKMMTWVSISGTALAIFLIMAIFMADRLKELELAPVSERDRILTGQGIDFSDGEGTSASGMGIDFELAKKLYSDLDGVERISFIKIIWGRWGVGLRNETSLASEVMGVDDEFWKIYDYKFVSGSPFEKEEIASALKLVIITQSLARRIFNETDVAGREINIDDAPYIIKGVVEDQYPLLPDGGIDVFITFTPEAKSNYYEGVFGNTNVRLLLKRGIDSGLVKQQVAKRYEDLNRISEKENKNFSYHDQPYTSEELNSGTFGSNNNPRVSAKRIERGLYYTFLLLLPAINLSSMTRSRLRHRISEIGVRRAFGAKKRNIIGQIFMENFLISLFGGLIGLGLSVLFLLFMSEYFITNVDIMSDSMIRIDVSPVIWNIFDWTTFFIAIGACFVLNLLSATVPSWKAASIEPANAIAKSR
ncbi:MAG: ABC transporter permease [Muribaculaceae bacterium]|nr:ABC transporter permease [Muribaculaceae bacterium]